MLFSLKEFGSLEEYNRWLTIMGEHVRVMSMTTIHHSWSVEKGTGAVKDTPVFLITYKEIDSDDPKPTEWRCTRCGNLNEPGFRYCGDCGTPLFKPK